MLKKLDLDALERAMALCKKLDPERYRELSATLGYGETWEHVAKSVAAWMQYKTLGLRPWETPPCQMWGPPTALDAGGRLLLQQMLEAGLSEYEPDPLRALAARKPTPTI